MRIVRGVLLVALVAAGCSSSAPTKGTVSDMGSPTQPDAASGRVPDAAAASAADGGTREGAAEDTSVADGAIGDTAMGDVATGAGPHKWNPTLFAQTVDINNSTSAEQGEIDALAASFVQYPALAAIVGGYAMWRDWVTLEPNALGVYDFSSIDATFNYLQQKIPGARLAIGLRAYSNGTGVLKPDAGSSVVPAYIFNGDPATYGHSNVGANGAGWAFAWDGNAYSFAFAALWNASVMNRWTQLFAALASHSITLQYGPYANQTFTYDKHPLVEAFNDFTPDDVGMHGDPTVPADYSASQFLTNWLNRPAALQAAVPNTSVMLMPGFGFGDVTNEAMIVQAMAENGIAVSCTDATTEPTTNATDLSFAQHYFVGDALTSETPITWSSGGGTDYRGKTPSMPTIQPLDLARGTSSARNTQAEVVNCMNIAYSKLKADHVFVSMASSATYDPNKDWAGSTGYIAPALLAVGGIPTANRARPSGY
jgi:hypothetical protein